MELKSIGYARNDVKKQRFGNFADVVSEIIINPQYKEGLNGLQDYSHIIVIYWMNEAEGNVRLRHRPQGNPDVPELGIFATRCQWRPNCVGITTVPLISIDGNIVRVKGLDVIDNTPIIDIKPYLPDYDNPDGATKVPQWTRKLVYK